MSIQYQGKVSQVTSESCSLAWHDEKAWTGNEIKYSSISSIDAKLDTSRFHISMPIKGVEPYIVNGEPFHIKPGEYLVFNPHQQVRAKGDFPEEVKGYCLFLTEKTICETAHSLKAPIEKSLEVPFEFEWQQQEFMMKTYKLQENSFGKYLHQIQQQLQRIPNGEAIDWDLVFLEIAKEFLEAHRQIGNHLQSIPCVNNLTRQEIYRRLSQANGYILENFDQSISLDDLQKTALLSKYHLVRLYRQVYGLTPYQHLLRRRIEKAKMLLMQDYSPTEIAIQLSFSDRRAFAKIFKKMVGIPPSVFQESLKNKA